MTMLVKNIIDLEWEMFSQVENRGGRAPCQENGAMFADMRANQLEAWNGEMLESYYQDLREAKEEGRNSLGEKYGYMMERTSPAEYEEIKDQLPPRTLEKDYLIDWISEAHVTWQEELARQYPHLTGQGRVIRKSGDSLTTTSFETYLWGELATYSVRTLRLYAAYVEQLQKTGKSMNRMILENTVARCGYGSLEAAELRLSGKAC